MRVVRVRFPLQPIVDRVAQNPEIISENFFNEPEFCPWALRNNTVLGGGYDEKAP